jgi:hypothetical protein
MPSILLTESAVAAVKADLAREYRLIPEIKSSHLSEALARAAGFRTHASLLAHMRNTQRMPAPEDDYRLLNYDAFRLRLDELSGIHEKSGLDGFETGNYAGLVDTHDGRYADEYCSARHKAFRNLLVAAINAGLNAGLFTIRPGDNRWPGAVGDTDRRSVGRVQFELAGLPAYATFSDIGCGELSVGAALKPTSHTLTNFYVGEGLHAGDAVGHSWLERERGAWLQSATTRFWCRRAVLPLLSAATVEPLCFGDRGRVVM